nr:hypothetical protein [Enterococcus sp. 7F3_DIV0205]OTN84682.1 hypothetical protein A5821_000611 [Enterococcus sp. 7F3_DIV0205]
MAINSNSSIAGGISASFSQSASALNSISVSVSASSTNVSGNGPAVQSLNNYQQGLAALSTSVAVSYTHLDVYKRITINRD